MVFTNRKPRERKQIMPSRIPQHLHPLQPGPLKAKREKADALKSNEIKLDLKRKYEQVFIAAQAMGMFSGRVDPWDGSTGLLRTRVGELRAVMAANMLT